MSSRRKPRRPSARRSGHAEADAEAERQRQARPAPRRSSPSQVEADAEAERQRQARGCRGNRGEPSRSEAEAERQRQVEASATAEADRQRAAQAEADRLALAAIEAERQRDAQAEADRQALAAIEAERLQQAEAEREREAQGTDASPRRRPRHSRRHRRIDTTPSARSAAAAAAAQTSDLLDRFRPGQDVDRRYLHPGGHPRSRAPDAPRPPDDRVTTPAWQIVAPEPPSPASRPSMIRSTSRRPSWPPSRRSRRPFERRRRGRQRTPDRRRTGRPATGRSGDHAAASVAHADQRAHRSGRTDRSRAPTRCGPHPARTSSAARVPVSSRASAVGWRCRRAPGSAVAAGPSSTETSPGGRGRQSRIADPGPVATVSVQPTVRRWTQAAPTRIAWATYDSQIIAAKTATNAPYTDSEPTSRGVMTAKIPVRMAIASPTAMRRQADRTPRWRRGRDDPVDAGDRDREDHDGPDRRAERRGDDRQDLTEERLARLEVVDDPTEVDDGEHGPDQHARPTGPRARRAGWDRAEGCP